MWATVALVVTLLAIVFYRSSVRPSGFPPGPFVLPFLGSFLSILPGPKESFPKFQKKYGGICSIKMFTNWMMLINEPRLMKQLLADPAFSARKHLFLFETRDEIITKKVSPPNLGVIGTSGEVWKQQRRFTLRSLKDLGFGKNSLEPIMQQELEELLDVFTQKAGEKFEVGLTFNSSIVNVIWALVIGQRFSHTDLRLQQLVDKVNRMLQSFNPFHPAWRFRIIRKLFPNLTVFKNTNYYMSELLTFVEEEFASHEQELRDGGAGHSYVAAYLNEIRQAEEEGRDTPLTVEHLRANIMELFIAGSETTSSTLVWAVYLLAAHPEVLARLHQELDRVVGSEHLPTLAHIDHPGLPYTTAAIYEIQRVADLVPFAIPHETTEPVVVEGYHIPAGMTVMFNLSHGLHDPQYWRDPEGFCPEHFLNDDGKPFKPEAFMPFGSGKRVCLGESLARLELFLFLTTLVHRFSWRLSDDPVVWEKATVLSRPPRYKIITTCRNVNAKF